MIDRFRPSVWLRFCQVAFAVVALILSVTWVHRAIPEYLPRDWAAAHEADSLADWKGARLVLQGKSPYTKEGLALIGESSMGHPPTAPFWYLPLAIFEKPVVAELSSVLLLLLLPLHAFLCARELRFPVPLATALLTFSAVVSTAWLKYHYEVIQYSEPIAFLYVLAWLCLRRGRDLYAGACLGVALTLKLFPGLLLVFLLLARRFRAFFAAAGVYLAVAAVMTRAYGPECWVSYFRAQRAISNDWLGVLQNSSLPGLIVRVITPACKGEGDPTPRTTLISLCCSLVLVGLAAWGARASLKEAREANPRAIDLPFSLFVLLSAFLNAWAWEHYFVLTIQPLFVLLATFSGVWWATLRRWAVEDCPTRRLWIVSMVSLIGVLGVLLTCYALNADYRERGVLLGLWFKYHTSFYHRRMHWLEAENFAPWVVPILLCFLGFSLPRTKIGSVS
jgi:hypothetical protein